MTRLEFMKELEGLLLNIPSEEREEALGYYNGYFDDAGEDQEVSIIQELGSPSRLAAMIKEDLNQDKGSERANGYYTENGYRKHINNEYEVIQANTRKSEDKEQTSGQQTSGPYSSYQREQKKSDKTAVFLILLLTSPFWLTILLPIAFSIFGVAVGVIAAVFGIIVAFGIAGIALAGAGIFLFIAGFVKLAVPFIGLLLIGSGLLVFGIGMLLTLVTALICRYVVPPIVEGFVNLCRLPFKNRRAMA